MLSRIRIVCAILCLFISLKVNSQKVDSSYLLYPTQFEFLSKLRGIPDNEVEKRLEEYKANNIKSNEDFAKLLGQYYPPDKDIAVLLYFFNNNVLKRILFEPGKIIEEKEIPITSKQLFDLNENLIRSLDLYRISSDRSPTLKRGGRIEHNDSLKKDPNKYIKELTSILIPENFKTSYRYLLVIPALNIGSIPFHLLKPYHNEDYLIDKCSFTVAPTLLDFIFLRSKFLFKLSIQAGRNKIHYSLLPEYSFFNIEKPLFVCNPVYPVNTDFHFPNLPGTELEIKNAMSIVPNRGKLLKGKDAIKDSILKYMNGSDLAYFATHGVGDTDSPMTKSFLVLSGQKPFLTAKEILELRLDKNYRAPEMVILSACQTGLGKSTEAGMASLARSFILSGSNFVIESLWNIDDNATAFLMSQFFSHLQTKSNHLPAEALRLAILDTKKKYPQPIYWASFTSFGTDW